MYKRLCSWVIVIRILPLRVKNLPLPPWTFCAKSEQNKTPCSTQSKPSDERIRHHKTWFEYEFGRMVDARRESRRHGIFGWIVVFLLATVTTAHDYHPASLSVPPEISVFSRLYDDKDDVCRRQSSKYDLLACWLLQFNIELPDQTFRVGILTLDITHLTCTKFGVQGVSSSSSSSSSSSNTTNTTQDRSPTLQVQVDTIQAYCSAQYASTGIHGDVQVTVGMRQNDNIDNQSTKALDWTLAFQSSVQKGLPYMMDAIHTTECHTALVVTDIHFTGSISARIVALFQHVIANYISNTLNDQLCNLITQQVDPQLSSLVQSARTYLDSYARNDIHNHTNINDNDKAPRMDRQQHRHTSFARDEWELERSVMDHSNNLVDFSTDAPSLMETLSSLNAFVQNYLSQGFLRHWFPTTFVRHDCHASFDGVNGIVTALTGGHLELVIPSFLQTPNAITITIPDVAQIGLSLQQVVALGIDHWTNLTVLQPLYQREFISEIASKEKVGLRANVTMTISSIDNENDTVVETVQIELNATTLKALAALELGMSQTAFTTLSVGTIIDAIQGLVAPDSMNHNTSSNALDCFLKGIAFLKASDLQTFVNVSGASIQSMPNILMSESRRPRPRGLVTGELEQDLDELVNNVLKLVLTEYQEYITRAISGLVKGPLRQVLNVFLNTTVLEPYHDQPYEQHCPLGPQAGENAVSLLNFSDFVPLAQFNNLLNDPFTLEQINDYVNCASEFLGRGIQSKFPETLFSALGQTDELGVLDALGSSITSKFFKLRELHLVESGSLQEIQLFSADNQGTLLSTSINYGASNALNFSTNEPHVIVGFDVNYAPLNLSMALNFTIYIDSVDVKALTLFEYDLNQLKRLNIAQLAKHRECLIVPVTNVQDFVDTASSLGFFGVTVNGTIDNGKENGIKIVSLDSRKYPAVAETASSLFYWAVNSTRDMANTAGAATLSRAKSECGDDRSQPGDDDHDKSKEQDDSQYTSILIIMSAVFLLTQPTLLLIRRSRDKECSTNDSNVGQHENGGLDEPLLPPDAIFDDETTDGEMANKTPSLMSTAHSEVMRYAVPTLILVTVVLLISSNLSIGATIDLKLVLDGQVSFSSPSLFAFSLYETAKAMWQARIFALFLLVIVFSGIWPYVKLILMLLCWIRPPRYSWFNTRLRGRILLALDALGKFSLVDAYLTALFVVAFRYHLDLWNELDNDADSKSVLDVFVTPKFGFYAFLLSTMSSMVVGHALVFYHRQSQLYNMSVNAASSTPSRLLDHAFTFYRTIEEGDKLVLSKRFRNALVGLLLVTITFLGVGITRESFVFQIGGLAGLALPDPSNQYSLLSLGQALRQNVEDPSSLGIIAFQVVYYFYTVVMPFACLLTLSVLLLVPLSLRRQLFLLTLSEITNAWSAIEVFALSILVAVWKMSSFASFMLGNRCGWIKALMKEYLDKEDDADATCYSIHAGVRGDAVLLIAGVLLNSFLVSTLLRLAHLATNERMEDPGECSIRHDGLLSFEMQQARRERLRRRSFAEWLYTQRCTSWMLSPLTEMAGSGIENNNNDSVVTPPWQNENSFQDEWGTAAERDPQWKEWKEATNVT